MGSHTENTPGAQDHCPRSDAAVTWVIADGTSSGNDVFDPVVVLSGTAHHLCKHRHHLCREYCHLSTTDFVFYGIYGNAWNHFQSF